MWIGDETFQRELSRARTTSRFWGPKPLSFHFSLHLFHSCILHNPFGATRGLFRVQNTMAQRSGQGTHNSWNDDFIPSIFNALNSPVVSATLPSNSNGHFTSANSNPFPGQGNHNISSGSHQDHTLQAPFSISPVNGTNSRVEQQGRELVNLLLQEVAPTKREMYESIKNDVQPALEKEIRKESLEKIKDLEEELKRLMEAWCKDLGNKLWTQLSRQLQENL